jgi:hypothetical protein
MQTGLWRTLALSTTLAVTIGGCGSSAPDRPATVPVKGKVTYKGQPVTKGTVSFQPDQGSPATAEIQPDGTYSLSTFQPGDGAVPGHYRVGIIANTADPTMIPGSTPGYKPPKDLVPKKYNDPMTSGLEATVSKDGKDVDLDLK